MPVDKVNVSINFLIATAVLCVYQRYGVTTISIGPFVADTCNVSTYIKMRILYTMDNYP